MRVLYVAIVAALIASVSFAEMDRSLYTRENRFPELYRPELTLGYKYTELGSDSLMIPENESDVDTYVAGLRLKIVEDLTLNAEVPFHSYSSDIDGDHDGIGDVTVGAALLAYEYIYDFPYVIPHVDHTFDTGDEDKHLGAGESYTTVGISVGTQTAGDVLHWIGDVGYQIREKSDNALVIGGSVIWDLSERFSVLGETQYLQVPDHAPQDDSYAIRYTGGLFYRATDMLSLAAYCTGAAKNTEEDMSVTLRATISM